MHNTHTCRLTCCVIDCCYFLSCHFQERNNSRHWTVLLMMFWYLCILRPNSMLESSWSRQDHCRGQRHREDWNSLEMQGEKEASKGNNSWILERMATTRPSQTLTGPLVLHRQGLWSHWKIHLRLLYMTHQLTQWDQVVKKVHPSCKGREHAERRSWMAKNNPQCLWAVQNWITFHLITS